MHTRIAGETYEVSEPYAEGHKLTAIEANCLNGLRAENIGHIIRVTLKEMTEASPEERQAFVTSHDKKYTLQARGGGRGAGDPVVSEALAMVRTTIKAKLKLAGKSLDTYKLELAGLAQEAVTDEEKSAVRTAWNNKVKELASTPMVMKRAKAAVAARELGTLEL